MRDILVELLEARKLKIFKEGEFEGLLLNLGENEGITIDWDSGAGEEWAVVSNDMFSIMINRRIGICFVRGTISESAISCLSQCRCVHVDGYDIKEWCVDLDDLRKCIPEISRSISDKGFDPHCFALNDFYVITV